MVAPVSVPKEKFKHQHFKKYHALDESGLARVGELLSNGDVYINKYAPVIGNDSQVMNQSDLANVEYKAKSEAYKGANPASVDRVIITSTNESPFLIKVITRQTRIPEIGDKFSSRHGQKGVVGLIVP